MKKEVAGLDGYNEILDDIRYLLGKAKAQAYKAVDNIRVQTYWQVGERIVRGELQHKERADYGEEAIANLAKDLGFIKRDLYRMVQFYRTYPIMTSLMSQLSWTHYTVLITIPNKNEREFYESQITQNNLSVRELRRRIETNLYNRVKKEGKLTVTTHLELPVKPEAIFKDAYDFDFLKLPVKYKEKDLEKALLQNVERLLLEFGADFSLSGRQRKIIIDGQIHTVDLEFYHRGIPCIILVDLKVGKFKAEYAGQMNKFLNYCRLNKKYGWERDPIGLIICEYKGKEEVHYALGNISNRIFVAEYKTKLPSEDEIEKRLRYGK